MMFNATKRTLTALALGLALATSASPALARPFDLNANGSNVPAGSVRPQAPSQSTPPLAAAAVLMAASAPSAAHTVLNPSPRGVAINVTQTRSAGPVVRSNPDQQTTPPSDSGAAPPGHIAGFRYCPRVGPCVSPDSILTQG
ncbi:MAG: hypothetical protein ACRDPA_03880, partial [Solirubrobacteraceae bacterium]